MILNVSETASDAMLDTVAGLLDGGSLELLSPNSEVLVTLQISDAGDAVDGELVFSLAEGVAVLTGEARFARAVAADGTEVFSCDCGDANSDAVLKLTPTEIHAGGRVRLDSFRLVMP